MTEAELIAAVLEFARKRDGLPAAPALTVAELYARYEAAQRHRPGWVTSAHVLRRVRKALEARPVDSLIAADWTSYRLSRADLAPSSLNLALRVLKAMLRWGRLEGLYRDLPQLCDAKKQPQKKHRLTATDETDVGRLLEEADKDRDRVIVLAAADAGMRNTEIRLLQWSWLDRVAMCIHLPGAITKNRKPRDVIMTGRLLAAIDRIPRDIRSPYVLRSYKTGGPYCRAYVSVLFRGLAERAELVAAEGDTRVHLHDARAGFATTALERGVPIEAVSELMGHATLEQTRVYKRRKSSLAAARATFEAGIERDKRR